MDLHGKEQAQKLELLGQMSGALLHDIKTPLTYLKSNNQYLQKKLPLLIKAGEAERKEIISTLFDILDESQEGLEHLTQLAFEHGDFIANK